MKCDPQNAIAKLLRQRVRDALKGKNKSANTIELTGCTVVELQDHLEGLFEYGMTWENHGKWHIDHRKPCEKFDLVNENEQKKCFHYSNLQPLWSGDNQGKGSSYDEDTFGWRWNLNKWEPI